MCSNPNWISQKILLTTMHLYIGDCPFFHREGFYRWEQCFTYNGKLLKHGVMPFHGCWLCHLERTIVIPCPLGNCHGSYMTYPGTGKCTWGLQSLNQFPFLHLIKVLPLSKEDVFSLLSLFLCSEVPCMSGRNKNKQFGEFLMTQSIWITGWFR